MGFGPLTAIETEFDRDSKSAFVSALKSSRELEARVGECAVMPSEQVYNSTCKETLVLAFALKDSITYSIHWSSKALNTAWVTCNIVERLLLSFVFGSFFLSVVFILCWN